LSRGLDPPERNPRIASASDSSECGSVDRWSGLLGSLPEVVAQEPAEAGPTENSALLPADLRPGVDQGVFEALVISLLVIMRHVFADRVVEVSLTEDHEPTQAFSLDRAHKSLGEGVQVGAARRKGHDLNATMPQEVFKGLGEEWVPVKDQVGLPSQEAVEVIEEVPSDLEEPMTVWVSLDPSNVDAASSKLHDEEDGVAWKTKFGPEEHPSYGCGGSAQPPLVRIGNSEPPAAAGGRFEPAGRNTGSLGAGGGRGSVHRALWRVWSALLTQAA